MSGPSMIKNFEAYITGYYLKTDNYYVIAKTWYALEMSRPGCVWTHSILIKTSDLDACFNSYKLLELFRRPSIDLDMEMYSRPIIIATNEIGTTTLRNIDITVIESILSGLYIDIKSSPILFPVQNPCAYEELVLLLWTQQATKYKKSFTFCTGAITSRTINGEILDLQFVPVNYKKQLKRDLVNQVIVKQLDRETIHTETEWISVAIDDLYHRSFSLRLYLKEFSDKYNNSRKTFSKLFYLYQICRSVVRKKTTLNNLVLEVKKLFPSKTDGRIIKKEMFGQESLNNVGIFVGLKEFDKLKELSITRNHNIFCDVDMDMRQRGKSFYWNNSRNALKLISDIAQKRLNRLGDQLFSGFADVISSEEIFKLAKELPKVIISFLRYMPTLALNKNFWLSIEVDPYEALNILSSTIPKESEKIGQLTNALLTANPSAINMDFVMLFGKRGLFEALNWLNNSLSNLDSHHAKWKRIVEEAADYCVEWLRKSNNVDPRLVAFIASNINPLSDIIDKYGLSLWVKFTKKFSFDANSKLSISAFLLPVALTRTGKDADNLLHFSWEIVYKALSENRLNSRSWDVLDKILPDVPIYRYWDRCYRLRKALRKRNISLSQWSFWD